MPADDALKFSTIKAILFDFGDTLARLAPPREEIFIGAAGLLGLDLELEAVRRAYQIVDFQNKYSSVRIKDRPGFYYTYHEKLCEALGISSYFVKLQPLLAARFASEKRWVLYEEVPGVLRRLRRLGLPLALVANWDSNLHLLAEELGISQAFAVIVASQTVGKEKPDPKIFRHAVGELSLSMEIERILYVGNDYRADVLGARGAGLIPVLIDRNDLYRHPDCLHFTSLLPWVESME